jgi:hypothetical protein
MSNGNADHGNYYYCTVRSSSIRALINKCPRYVWKIVEFCKQKPPQSPHQSWGRVQILESSHSQHDQHTCVNRTDHPTTVIPKGAGIVEIYTGWVGGWVANCPGWRAQPQLRSLVLLWSLHHRGANLDLDREAHKPPIIIKCQITGDC